MEHAPTTRRPGVASRRVGYVVAVAVNAVALWISHQLLDWGWPRFLDTSFEELLPIVTVSFVASMAVNAIYLAADPPWFKSLGDAATAAISFVVAARTWQVFPFDFSTYAVDWSTLVRVVLVVAMVGSAIAVVVNLAHLPGQLAHRHAMVGTPPTTAPPPATAPSPTPVPAPQGSGHAVVVYESMFGATHEIAERVAEGLRDACDVRLVSVHDATPEVLDRVELLVVGGPTHIHGMSTSWSRGSAVQMAEDPDATIELDPDAEGEGLRDWFHALPSLAGVPAAAFDTRIGSVSAAMSGQASKGIARRLRQHGLRLVATPESFLVDDENALTAGEADRAVTWARSLVTSPSRVG